MLEDSNLMDVTSKQMNLLFTNPKRERDEYENISEKNLTKITDSKNCLLNMMALHAKPAHEQDLLNNYLKLKQTNVLNAVACSETEAQVQILKSQLRKKEKLLLNLQMKQKALAASLEKLQIENEILNQKNKNSFKVFQLALKFYTRNFQYDISMCDSNLENTDSVKINFIFETNKSPWDIIFYFDKQTQNLTDFSATDIMSQKQREILLSRFKCTNNYLAFFYILRSFVYKKTVN